MSDPTPSRGLPEAEYIEVYNPQDTLNVAGWTVADASGRSGRLLANVIYPKQWVVLCAVKDTAIFADVNVVAVDPWPALNNDGDIIIIRDQNNRRSDSISYSISWHSVEGRKGGVSLSLRSLDFRCSPEYNWFSSTEPDGGSPGRKNSGMETRAVYPEVIHSYAGDEIYLWFNTEMDRSSINAKNITATDGGKVDRTEWSGKRLMIGMREMMNSEWIEIVIKDAFSCSGAFMDSLSVKVKRGKRPLKGDIIVNEVMFDPNPGEGDYLEVYNRSGQSITMHGMQIVAMRRGETADTLKIDTLLMIEPGEFKVFTKFSEMLRLRFPQTPAKSLVQMDDMVILPPDRSVVYLFSKESVPVEEIYYDYLFHHMALQERKGVALERRNIDLPAISERNWASAAHVIGFGTPGRPNSQDDMGGDISIRLKEKEYSIGGAIEISYEGLKANSTATIRVFTFQGYEISVPVRARLIGVSGQLVLQASELQIKAAGVYFLWIEILSDNGLSERFIRKFYALY